jgi:uncharacterized protein YrrD
MRVDLGTTVYARDGDKVGTIDRIVVDPTTKQIDKLIVGKGFLTHHDIIVDLDMVTRQTDEGVYLDLTSDQVNELPEFVEDRYTVVDDRDRMALPFMVPNAGGAGMYLWGATDMGRGYDRSGSMFEPAPATPPEIQPRSNVPDEDIMISEGTDVVGSDGEKVGTVDQVVFDADGKINGFIVKAGLIFSRDVRVPIDWVDQTGDDHIRLRVSSDQAEARSFDIEDSTL